MTAQVAPTSSSIEPTTSLSPRVSIVIPMRNEQEVIGRCLQAVLDLDFPRARLDVVLVDNGSEDESVAIARSFADRVDLRILSLPGIRISGLRNAGASVAKGEILAFLDADCLPRPDWLRTVVTLIKEHGRAIVGSDYLIPAGSSWVARAWYGSDPLPGFARVAYVPAGDLVVGRAVFDEIGGFNEGIQTNEDCEFCLRAGRAGFPVYASASMAVTHLGTPQTAAQFFRKHRWHGTHVLRVFRQNARTLQNLKPLAFAAYVLVALIAVMIGIVKAIASGGVSLLAMSMSALVALPVVLAAHKAVVQRNVANAGPLSVLFLVYGVARALSLLNPKNW